MCGMALSSITETEPKNVTTKRLMVYVSKIGVFVGILVAQHKFVEFWPDLKYVIMVAFSVVLILIIFLIDRFAKLPRHKNLFKTRIVNLEP